MTKRPEEPSYQPLEGELWAQAQSAFDKTQSTEGPRGFSVWKRLWSDFPGSTLIKNARANAADTSSIPGPGRFHMPQSN